MINSSFASSHFEWKKGAPNNLYISRALNIISHPTIVDANSCGLQRLGPVATLPDPILKCIHQISEMGIGCTEMLVHANFITTCKRKCQLNCKRSLKLTLDTICIFRWIKFI
jgi:hypothetical protein